MVPSTCQSWYYTTLSLVNTEGNCSFTGTRSLVYVIIYSAWAPGYVRPSGSHAVHTVGIAPCLACSHTKPAVSQQPACSCPLQISNSTQSCLLPQPKNVWLFRWYISNVSLSKKIFEGEILIRAQPTTLLQIFRELILYSKDIFKSVKVPDDSCL